MGNSWTTSVGSKDESDETETDGGKTTETVSEQSEDEHEVSVSSVSEMDENDDTGSTEETTDESQSENNRVVPDGAIPLEDMISRERRWKIMVWGKPGLFKSHFAYTMPEPIVFIDLEGKADDISHKFKGKEIYFWQPANFREVQESLDSALDFLETRKDETGEVGTVVIDSIGMAWDWAKFAYKRETNPMKDESELRDVSLSSNMGSSRDSDWTHIKGMHNDEFRSWMVESDFHFLWTAGQKEDYNAKLSGDSDEVPMIADGEKDNIHKADTIIRAKEGENGEKLGDLVKSNFTEKKFKGLELPTFPKVSSIIEDIEESEQGVKNLQSIENSHGIEVTRGKP